MNNELKKNAEGYVDPTAAATLSKQEPGDIWTYMNQECLILKNHGNFSTCLLLGKTRRNSLDVAIQTDDGPRYTDPRKLTWGAHYKMTCYLGYCSLTDYGAVVTAVKKELGVELPCDCVANTVRDLSEFETQVVALQAHRDELLKQNDFLRSQLEQMTELHAKAVDRVNKATFAKLKVENQLELLQNMVGSVLVRFQIDTEEALTSDTED